MAAILVKINVPSKFDLDLGQGQGQIVMLRKPLARGMSVPSLVAICQGTVEILLKNMFFGDVLRDLDLDLEPLTSKS